MADERQELLAAGLQLEHELDLLIAGFAQEHGALVRRACQIVPEQVDLAPVVLTTLFGHVVSRMRKAHGSVHVERVAQTLLEQMDQAEARAAQLRAGEPLPPKEAMH